jgi:excisionase family DNA binding protein
MSETPDLLPIGEAARRLGVSVETIRRWDRAGKITSTRTVGGQRRFPASEVERLLGAAA